MSARPKYEHIEKLKDDEFGQAKSLKPTADRYKEKKKGVADDNDLLKSFNDKLTRKLSIETGEIEGLYTIEKGTTVTLIENGFVNGLVQHGSSSLSEEDLYQILEDHQNAVDFTFDYIKGNREFSNAFIKDSHALLTQSQETIDAVTPDGKKFKKKFELKGTWKTQPNNPTTSDGTEFCYCPPEQVQQEMDNLVDWYNELAENNTAPEVLAAWLHHRFTLIHPFEDGNGRVARILASMVFIKADLFPLSVGPDRRLEYLDALTAADNGDLSKLINLFVEIQEEIAFEAMDIIADIELEVDENGEFVEDFNEKEFLAGRHSRKNAQAHQVLKYMGELAKSFVDDLDTEVKAVSSEYSAYHEYQNLDELWKSTKSFLGNKTMVEIFATSGILYVISIETKDKHQLVFSAVPVVRGGKYIFYFFATFCREYVYTKTKFEMIGNGITNLFSPQGREVDVSELRYDRKALLTNSPLKIGVDEKIEPRKKDIQKWLERVLKLTKAELKKYLA
jgi:Fic family protein